jgi:transcriptional regulator with XRE-family HTH domain
MMELAGETPHGLAARLGVSVATIDAWLYGRHLEKVATILGAFEALGCVVKILPMTKRPDTPCVLRKTHM